MSDDLFTYRIDLTYDGTEYSGWQIQPHSLSIQHIVQEAVRTLVREPVHVIGSGRTDAGVHAYGQVAHFRCHTQIECSRFLRSLNGILPRDIRATAATSANNTFHSQRSAVKKEYHYHLCLGPIVSPFTRLYCHHIPYPVDLDLLSQGSALFVGEHDFTSFANSAHTGAAAKNPVRTIYRLDLVPSADGVIIQFEADGFLYKMVRNIVGTLLDVATLKRPLSDIPALFTARDRRLASMAAPAHGLFLVKVFY